MATVQSPDDSKAFSELEQRLSRDVDRITSDDLRHYVANIEAHPLYAHMSNLKKISMLHIEALFLLRLFALHPKGGILEIGPYIGGSTAVIASAVMDGSGAPYVSIEAGGRYPEHPQLPSKDIFRDLERNIRSTRLDSYVRLIEGNSDNPAVVQAVKETLGEAGIGFLTIDADGLIERDIACYRSMLNANCIMAFDDYSTPSGPIEGGEAESMLNTWKDPTGKANLIRTSVDEAVRAGWLEPFGSFGYGTWFGRYRGE